MIFLAYIVLYLASLIGIFAIALLVYRASRTLQNRYFAYFTAAVSSWLGLQFLAQVFHDEHQFALTLLRIAVSAAPLLAYVFLTFVREYTHAKRKLSHYWIAFPIFVLCVSWTSALVRSADISRYGIAIRQVGLLYIPTLTFAASFFLAGIIIIMRDYLRHRQDIVRRSQSRLLMGGLLQLMLIAFVGSIFLANNVISQILVPLSALVMAVVVAYAIVRHGLFDVRFIIARALTYLLVIFTVTVLYTFLVFGLLFRLLPPTGRLSFVQQLPFFATAIIVAYSLQPLRARFNKLTNRVFYRDAYDTDALYDQLNKLLVSTYDLNLLLRSVNTLLSGALKPTYMGIELKEMVGKGQRFVGTEKVEIPLDEILTLRRNTSHSRQSVIATDLLDSEDSREFKQLLQRYDIAVLVRLAPHVKRDTEGLGYLILGPKHSGNMYSGQDLRVLDTVANELILAIQNALRFEEIQGFNRTLQGKVTDATRQLRNTNEKLRTLDTTKDEFITMASHQLRTPLTSVKGYLSMVLEGDAGKITAQQRQLLNQSYQSAQRMVFLISDLLNLSRLNTGKFVIESSPVDLREVVQAEIGQVAETAKSREVALAYENPASFPKLMLDETKIHQVVMNFIDNAIYYTPAGGSITVSLTETPTTVEYRVKDTGIGVPRAVQHRLFSKFYRADNARRARPDGTGLGLFMAKKVIAAQGGAIIFESEEGKGSTFGFRFSKAHHLAPETKPA